MVGAGFGTQASEPGTRVRARVSSQKLEPRFKQEVRNRISEPRVKLESIARNQNH